MHLDTVIDVEDPGQKFRQIVEPEITGKVKQATITMSHAEGVTRVKVSAEDVTSMRTGMVAIMNALRVFDKMSEVSSNGHPAKH